MKSLNRPSLMVPVRPKLALAFALVLGSAACTSNKQIEVYSSPKERPAPLQGMGGNSLPPAMPQQMPAEMPAAQAEGAEAPSPQALAPRPLEWTSPAQWQAGPTSDMRIGSFQTPGAGDASIVLLSGEAGGLEANINRWRGQIGLPAADSSVIRSSIRKGLSKLGPFQWTKLANPAQPDRGILAAVVPFRGSTVFVKLVAPLASLESQQGNFVALVKSLKPAAPERAHP